MTPTRRQAMAAGAALAVTGVLRAQDRGPSPRVVACPAGRFVGTAEPRGVTAFRGIRYGTAERFRAARPYRYAQVHEARDFGPVCPQRGKYRPQSEDCLFLNVWTSAPGASVALPVMVYIHGGAYANGSATDAQHDGRHLAARGDAVVVTVNHRLNALGYLYLARLDPRFPDSGNNGQLDLILALRWVQENIAAFGGDPGRVMIFGQSGGGGKCATLTAMPAARGLFHRVATMSGQQVTASGPQHATRRAQAYLARLGVSERDLSPLLTMPVERLLDALPATDPIVGGPVYMGPVLDMTWLTRHPFWPDANPLSTRVPMMLGNTLNETKMFFPPDSAPIRALTWENVSARIAEEVPSDIMPEYVLAEYRRHRPDWSPQDVFYAATTDGRSWRGQVEVAEARARAGAPTWVYQVDFQSRTNPDRGAFHCIDIPLVFGTLDVADAWTGTGPDAHAVSRAMQDRFVAFAKTGNPDPRWPRYDLATRRTMIFDDRVRVEADPRGWQRELFARWPYIQPGT